ncbi:hypothetical protein BH11PSE5_BH11PSE5_24560 [soil metagenome]|jgi:hypothetical protein|nr:hypothetical protein SPH9361_04419 [Sphingobium sp. CECT 9361]
MRYHHLAMAVCAVAFGATTSASMAQTSAVQRANDRERQSIDYRSKNCPSGDRAACQRANEKARDSIEYRNRNATRYQRDPNAAVERANRRDLDSAAYRSANCAPGNQAACARANEKARDAVKYRTQRTRAHPDS